jgi:hypothetical protein
VRMEVHTLISTKGMPELDHLEEVKLITKFP